MKKNIINKQNIIVFSIIFFYFFFFINVISVYASGIYLYSYTTDKGEEIVVEDKSEIPEKCRNNVTQYYVGGYTLPENLKNIQNKKAHNMVFTDKKSEHKNKAEIKNIRVNENKKKVKKTSAIEMEPIVKTDYAAASASVWLKKLEKLQLNNERLHIIALLKGADSIPVRILHTQNINLMSQILKCKKFIWKGHERWINQAKRLTEQLQVLEYTITHWLETSPKGIIKGLPPLLEASRIKLDKLKSDYKKQTKK